MDSFSAKQPAPAKHDQTDDPPPIIVVSKRGNSYDPRTVALSPGVYPRAIRWAVDHDYGNALPWTSRIWLSRFLGEYYKGSIKKGDPTALNADARAECYRRKKHMMKDGFGRAQAFDNLLPYDALDLTCSVEEDLIEWLDRQRLPTPWRSRRR